MTRDEVSLLMQQSGVNANVDDVYYIVAGAIKREREACVLDVETERECWTRGRNDMGVMVCDYILQAIKKRGMA